MTYRIMMLAALAGLAACAPQPYQSSYSPSSYSIPAIKAPEPSPGDATPTDGWRANKLAMNKSLQAAIEAAARSEMKDPDSSKFRNIMAFKLKDGGIAGCGEINGKNSYGGYAGFTPFRAVVVQNKNKYTGVGAFFQDSKYPMTFYQIYPMCDPKNW